MHEKMFDSLLFREMHIKVVMRYRFTLVRVGNTGNTAIASIGSREKLSSNVRYFHLWESNLVTFTTKLKTRYPMTRFPLFTTINKSNNQFTAAFFVWQRSRIRMNDHKWKKSWTNGGPSTPWTKVQPLKEKVRVIPAGLEQCFSSNFSGLPAPWVLILQITVHLLMWSNRIELYRAMDHCNT